MGKGSERRRLRDVVIGRPSLVVGQSQKSKAPFRRRTDDQRPTTALARPKPTWAYWRTPSLVPAAFPQETYRGCEWPATIGVRKGRSPARNGRPRTSPLPASSPWRQPQPPSQTRSLRSRCKREGCRLTLWQAPLSHQTRETHRSTSETNLRF